MGKVNNASHAGPEGSKVQETGLGAKVTKGAKAVAQKVSDMGGAVRDKILEKVLGGYLDKAGKKLGDGFGRMAHGGGHPKNRKN